MRMYDNRLVLLLLLLLCVNLQIHCNTHVWPRQVSQKLALYAAPVRGRVPLSLLDFPSELDEARYTIVDTDWHSLFINVQHNDDYYGNLYVAVQVFFDIATMRVESH
jgi:ssDNA-specific exonuclease RecJ